MSITTRSLFSQVVIRDTDGRETPTVARSTNSCTPQTYTVIYIGDSLSLYSIDYASNSNDIVVIKPNAALKNYLDSYSKTYLKTHPRTVQATNAHSQTGFTLVEIIVVVVILSIFAGMMTLSVGSSDVQKNRAFYEHLTDSLSYVRLLSAERMQPMGLRLQADNQGQVIPVIVTLSNPYVSYQRESQTSSTDSNPRNSMELSGMSSDNPDNSATPSWDIEPDVTLPELPNGVSLNIQSLETQNTTANGVTETRALQPWFTEQSVPQILWFGTGQATPVTIEVRYDTRLVGEVITIMPDGNLVIGQGS